MATELEVYARMMGELDREPVDSAALLEESLRKKIGLVSTSKIQEIENEIRNSGNSVESPQVRKVVSKNNSDAPLVNASTEKLLMALYDIRESLVEAFETCSINSKTASSLSIPIHKIASCIRYMGGDIEEFEPLNHVSGLKTPDFYKNAQKVVETTAQYYSLGDIEDAQVLDNGKKIAIVFSGVTEDVKYRAIGTITTDEWTGNEAIDYIYTPREGKMSVKSFENGRWVDRSDSGKYKVHWELEESDLLPLDENEPPESIVTSSKIQEDATAVANINSDDEDIGNTIR